MNNENSEISNPSSDGDEIIGIAFRWSMIVLGLVGVGGCLVYFFWPRYEIKEIVQLKDTEVIKSLDNTAVDFPDLAWQNIAAEAGIDFVHFSGASGKRLLPETMGGGVALFDYDNNGTLDVLFVSGTAWPDETAPDHHGSSIRLYSNQGNLTFRDVTVEAGLDCQLQGMGVAIGDFDNDGWIDLYITCVGANRLYRNDRGKFKDVTETSGVAGGDQTWSSAAGFFDFDGDGMLDLLVCNYVQWTPEIDFELNFTLNGIDRAYGPPTHYQGVQPYLFRNLGNGQFAEIAEAAGLHVTNPDREVPVGKSLGLLLIDINGDGWDDVLIANDTVRNFLFLNRQDGTFDEVGGMAGIAYDRTGRATGAMGVDIGQLWNDSSQAIAIGNFANEMSSLYVSQHDPISFVDESAALGVGAPSRQRLTFGMLWADFDLDGRLDLLQVNGHLEESIQEIQPSQTYRQPAQLFWNTGQDKGICFKEIPANLSGDLSTPMVGRGAAVGDLNGDGALDLVVTQIDGPPMVLINRQQTGNSFLRVKLIGQDSNRFAFGARVEVELGDRVLVRHQSPTRSYLSQNEPVLHFGIPKGISNIEKLRIQWPNDSLDERTNIDVGQTITFEQQSLLNPSRAK